jgi:hypothetical protein
VATYFVKSGTGGTDAGTSWANAAESIAGLMAAQAIAGGDVIYVHNTHNYLAGAAITWTLPETGTGLVQVICVDGGDATGASLVGTTVGSITTGAVESTNGNFAFALNTSGVANGALFVHGLTIKAGAGGNSSSADITIAAGAGRIHFSACTIWVDSTSTTAVLTLSNAAAAAVVRCDNCTFRYGATAQGITLGAASTFEFWNCSISASGSSPTTLFNAFTGTRALTVECHSCDWSLATNLFTVATPSGGGAGTFRAWNCVIGTPTTGTHAGYAGMTVELHACAAVDGTNGADVLAYYFEDACGTVEDSQSVYLTTGGAQGEQDDGTDTSYSLVMTPSASCTKATPLYSPWVYALVSSTGDKTVTLKVAHTEAAVLTTSEIWMEVEYMGEPGATGTTRVANSPHAQVEVDDNCNVMASSIVRDVTAAGSNRSDTAAAWTGIASEKTHTLTASINCAEVGYLRCRVGLGKDTTNPVYVDPKISVT